MWRYDILRLRGLPRLRRLLLRHQGLLLLQLLLLRHQGLPRLRRLRLRYQELLCLRCLHLRHQGLPRLRHLLLWRQGLPRSRRLLLRTGLACYVFGSATLAPFARHCCFAVSWTTTPAPGSEHLPAGSCAVWRLFCFPTQRSASSVSEIMRAWTACSAAAPPTTTRTPDTFACSRDGVSPAIAQTHRARSLVHHMWMFCLQSPSSRPTIAAHSPHIRRTFTAHLPHIYRLFFLQGFLIFHDALKNILSFL